MSDNWWNWLSWLWAVAALQLFWLLPVIILLFALIAVHHHRDQRISTAASHRLQSETATHGRGGGLTGAVRWRILGDGLTRALRWRLARTQRMIGGLAGRLAAAEMSLVELAPALNEMRLSAVELGPSTAVVSPEVAGKLYVGLYLGDCAVAAGILMANNAQLPLVLAAITSLAIATCQFAVGKVLGKALTERQGNQAPIAGPLMVLVLIGISLAALLHHLSWSWVFLAVTPALGAAALTVASHDPPRQRYHRAKSGLRGPRRRSVRALRRLGRSIGRASGAWTQAAALTTRGILAPELAEAAAADVIVVGANLTEQVRGIDSMLNDLDAQRIHGGFDEIVQRMGALLEQAARVTAVHLAAYQQAHGPRADDGAAAAERQIGPVGDSSACPDGPPGPGAPAGSLRPLVGPLADASPEDAAPNGTKPNGVLR